MRTPCSLVPKRNILLTLFFPNELFDHVYMAEGGPKERKKEKIDIIVEPSTNKKLAQKAFLFDLLT